ncbi:MAG: hypothetical protein LBR11_03795 [Deltaproteobacteria bacterium]|jgi:hypothetical protein|nr:hypothetical protein [Deltaproteobacteria bacterium]
MEAISHLTCSGCGASVEIIPGRKKLECPYCGTINSLFEEVKLGEIDPELVIPVGISPKDLHDHIHNILINDEDSPDDILDISQIESETIAFYPCFLAKGTFTANWTASFGYDRQEPYTAFENEYVNGRSQRVRVTRYRTVTDWRPASGVARGNYLALIYAGSELPTEVAALIPSFNPRDLTAFKPGHVAGYDLSPMTMTEAEAKPRLDPLINEQIRQEVLERAQGDHQRDWSWDKSLASEYLKPGLVPLAHGVFSYKGKSYHIWADGVDLSLGHRDPLPKDSARVDAIGLGYLPFILAFLTAAVCAFVVDGPFWYWPIFISLASSLILGVIRSVCVMSHSKAVKAASLARKKLEEAGSSEGLTEEARAALYQASQNPPKPFMARTDRDGLGISLATLIFVLLVLLGVFPKTWDKIRTTFNLGQSWSSPVESGPEEERQTQGSQNQNNHNQIEASPPQNSPAPPRLQGGSPPQALISPLKTGVQYAQLSELICSEGQPIFCKTREGREVIGLVGDEEVGEGGRRYLKSLFYFSLGHPSGVGLGFFPDGRVEWRFSFQSGYFEGPAFRYHPKSAQARGDGLALVTFYSRGQLEGLRFDLDSQGRLKSVLDRYVEGLEEGIWLDFYPDGSVKTEVKYANGQARSAPENFQPGQRLEDYSWVQEALAETREDMAQRSRGINQYLN